MSVENSYAILQNTDLGNLKGFSDGMKAGVDGINKALKGMGSDNQELYTAISLSSSALQVVGGTLGMLRGMKALYEARNAQETAEAAMLTSAKVAMGPPGWAQIAIAGTAMAVASVAMYAIVNTVQVGEFDLSTSAGLNGMVESVTGAMS